VTEEKEKKTTRRSMRTRSFLILIFGAVVVFTFVRVVYGLYNFDRLLNEYDERVTYNDRVNDAIDRAANVALDSETGLRGWLVTHDRRFLEPYERAAVVRESALSDLIDIEADQPRVKATAQRMTSRVHEWTRTFAEPIIAADGKSADPATALSLQLFGKGRMDLIRADIDELHGDLAERRKAEGVALKAYRDELARSAYGGTLFIALVFVGLGMLTVRRIAGPIDNIIEYLQRPWEKRFGPVNARGLYEIEELAHVLEMAANRSHRDQMRARHFTELVIKLSEGGDIDQLAYDALRWLVVQLEASGGVLWLVDDKELRLAASVGVHRESLEKLGNDHVKGILSTGKTERFDNLSGAKRIVRSALVDVAPSSLLIVPIRAGLRTIAIIEIAGEKLEQTPDLASAFDRVGLALDNAIGADRVKSLGTALAAANDELRAQMEELRAQGEELQAQAEELVEKQKQLSVSNTELEKGSRLKSEFLSDMSHELRTPLNAVLGFSELLIGDTYGKLNDSQRERIVDIAAAGRQLLTLVNDILDLSRIEAGRIELKLAPLDVRGPIEDALALMAPLAEAKKVRVAADLSDSLRAVADPDRLRQIVVNFLSNAIKFSPSGSVVSVHARVADQNVRIEVTDRGAGISRDDAKKLFAPFSQLKAGKAAGGAGLGLSISRRLVELMSGEIGVDSEVGKGATFFFTLPVSAAAVDGRMKTAVARTTSSGLHSAVVRGPKRRVLIVEDDEKHARATQEILGRAGHDVHVVGSAEAAISALEARKVDLLVVDLELPSMSGLSLIEQLRLEEAATPKTKPIAIVVLTGRNLTADERGKLEKHVDLVAEKGVMTGAGFLDAISGVCERSTATGKQRILVVDDSAINRSVLRAMLESAGFEVAEAERARDGIRMAQEVPPMVILMDIRMPDMNGLDATRALREDPRTGATPVIAVSAQAMTGDRELAFEAGCVAYVTKPVARQELLTAIGSVLQSSVAE
jgi:signal transduction histidine kinase/DNA-binding response OmpR family regulator/CHASE3 domain sensor protein